MKYIIQCCDECGKEIFRTSSGKTIPENPLVIKVDMDEIGYLNFKKSSVERGDRIHTSSNVMDVKIAYFCNSDCCIGFIKKALQKLKEKLFDKAITK